MNIDIIRRVFPEKAELIEQGRCPECGVLIDTDSFIDEASAKEFTLSGLCFNCQTAMLGDDIDDDIDERVQDESG